MNPKSKKLQKIKYSASLLILLGLIFGGSGLTSAFNITPEADNRGNPVYTANSSFISEVKESPIPFTGLAVKWEQQKPAGTEISIAVNIMEGESWTGWNKLEESYDSTINENGLEEHVAFIATNKSNAYQYRIILQTSDTSITPIVKNIEFTFVHAQESSESADITETAEPEILEAELNEQKTSFSGSVNYATSKNFNIISRKGWNANEDLRLYKEERAKPTLVAVENDFETKYAEELKIKRRINKNSKGDEVTWPMAYPEKVSKIIIHHTASTKNLDNPKQAIRDIYYWHSITRGWGDIGYNYIVDQQGNVYEGRYGGDGVVGAHAGKANIGSIGIAVLGNFEEEDVPNEVVESLSNLINLKAKYHNIDTTGNSVFRGENSPNIMGHKDVNSTLCPGAELYAKLPLIRTMSKGALQPKIVEKRRLTIDAKPDYDYEFSGMYELIKIDAGATKTVTISLKNTGTKEWGKDTYLLMSNNGSSKYFNSGNSLKSKPIGKTVKPGKTADFELTLMASYEGGFANLELFPMINGTEKIDKYITFAVQIIEAIYDYEFVGLSMEQYLKPGQTTEAVLKLKNIGTTNWKKDGSNKIQIGTENPRDHVSRLIQKPSTRLAQLTQTEVKPGETGTFTINIKAPEREGYYRQYFAPVIEGVTWLPVKNLYFEMYISSQEYSAKFNGFGSVGDFYPNEKKTVWMELDNKGRIPWETKGKESLRLEVSQDQDLKIDNFSFDKEKVLPGQSVKIYMTVTAPSSEGIYRSYLTAKYGDKELMTRPAILYADVVKESTKTTTYIRKAPQNNGSDIRVGLSFSGEPQISANGSFKVFQEAKETGEFGKNERVTVTYTNGSYHVRGDKKSFITDTPPRFKPVGSAILRIDNFEQRPAWKPSLNDNEYKGVLEVNYYENSLVVINELPLEDYLKGLAEISATDPYEKIKAVIVLARSYAKYYMEKDEKFPGAPYHLSDDPQRSQKYLGYGFEKRNTTGVKAVNDTAGEVVTYQGNLIKTPYFSSSDGRTRSAQEVWGWENTPYLISVDDPGCKGETLNGHGVGLSGCGAKYWAEQGKKYTDIIKYYFQGVKIEII